MRRLLRARKAWRAFTTKLQSKLHKLHRSKAIQKPNYQLNTTRKPAFWRSLSLQSRFNRKRWTTQPVHKLSHHRRHRLQKGPAPVYIDQLFFEPSSVRKQHQLSASAAASNRGVKTSSLGAKKKELIIDQQATVAGASNEDGDHGNHAADDMWESMVLASPQLHRINERAEEFITRFRAEMQLQEMVAHAKVGCSSMSDNMYVDEDMSELSEGSPSSDHHDGSSSSCMPPYAQQ
ncbi:hypothetical protein RJ639_009622 [Escallonia herrerae]|uniref:Uncharacterized protein n=1 Tax=Escallonia herrerae TaxID=1293975 RepID=A0AA88VVB0_9ASTE|nr:hypothetical protein RJ639_009622 [Escallonia herrerae]